MHNFNMTFSGEIINGVTQKVGEYDENDNGYFYKISSEKITLTFQSGNIQWTVPAKLKDGILMPKIGIGMIDSQICFYSINTEENVSSIVEIKELD